VGKKARRAIATNTLQQDLAQGLKYQRSGRLAEAIKSYSRALKQQPDNARIRTNLGGVLRQSGRHSEAIKHLAKAVALEPGLVPAYMNLALSQIETGRSEDALETYRRALLFRPNTVEARLGEGNTLRDLGRPGEAIAAFAGVLKLDPDNAQAHYFLAQMRNHRLPDEYEPEYTAMHTSYGNSQPGSSSRRDLAWGMGNAAQQRGEYDEAFAYLREAHRISDEQQTFDLGAARDYFASIRLASCPALAGLEDSDGGVDTDAGRVPIFVLGLPRSGTSLVEHILASNPAIFGAGEQRLIGNLCAQLEVATGKTFAEAFAELDGDAVGALARKYLEKLRLLSPKARHIVDKMPANFLSLGIIATMFPRAKIIHCRRGAMALCWSIYSTRFAEPHPFAHDLEDLGGYYRLYSEQMAYWQELFPGRIYNLDYERLVSDPESQVRALLEYCDLEYEDYYLQFYKTQRTVRTASAGQVRQPIYQSALDRYSPFESHLQPLRAALGDLI